MRGINTKIFGGLLWGLLLSSPLAEGKNGFDLSNATVPLHEIKRGGPPKDGIVALSAPEFVAAQQATTKPTERVLGIVVEGQARAYPVRFLNVHEIVNDRIGTQNFAITYCPLCGSGIAFALNLPGGGALNFGVSGLLYESDLLMYDRNTESLWSQIGGVALAGRLVGTRLPRLPIVHTTWEDWRSRHPDSAVMSGHPQFRRYYRQNPYPGYAKHSRLFFPVSNKAPDTYHEKEYVLGLRLSGAIKAYPFSELAAHAKERFVDQIGDQEVVIDWDEQHATASAYDTQGRLLAAEMTFWFAWYTFYPQTQVFKATPR